MPRHEPSHEDLPRFLAPMLARPGDVPAGEQWASEFKADGCRAIVRFDGRRLTVRSRPGNDLTPAFPELGGLAEALAGRRVMLDGELVCLDSRDGAPDFAALRQRLGGRPRRTPAPAALVVFDLLHCDGYATRELPYLRRRELLADLGLSGPHWRTARYWVGRGPEVAALAKEHCLEGVVSKRVDAPWVAGARSQSWVKWKARRQERLVVTGLRERKGAPDEFLVARVTEQGFRPAGSVAFGLDGSARAELRQRVLQGVPVSAGRRRAGGAQFTAEPVSVLVSTHGRLGGPIRDGVVCAVLD